MYKEVETYLNYAQFSQCFFLTLLFESGHSLMFHENLQVQYVIEFGILLNNEGKFQMYGAGLLSSENESECFCKNQTKVVPFTHAATSIGYNFSSFQKQFFFASSFRSLRNELKKFEKLLFNK